MASVQLNSAFEHASGALKKINKKSPHAKDQKMILLTHRVAETTSKDCQRLYVRDYDSVTRKTPVKPSEIIARERFAAIARAVNTRMHNVSTLAADQAAYKAQKATGYKSFRSYIWALQAEAYDQANG